MSKLTKPVSRHGNTWWFDGRIEATGELRMIDGVLADEVVISYRYTPANVFSLMTEWANGKLTHADYVQALDDLSTMPLIEKRIYHVPEFNWN